MMSIYLFIYLLMHGFINDTVCSSDYAVSKLQCSPKSMIDKIQGTKIC
jgi:hypothetical protein